MYTHSSHMQHDELSHGLWVVMYMILTFWRILVYAIHIMIYNFYFEYCLRW